MQAELLDIWTITKKTVIFVTHDLEEAIFLSDKVIVMSARPGRIRHIEEIALPRPRSGEMRLTDDFIAVKRKLWGMLEH